MVISICKRHNIVLRCRGTILRSNSRNRGFRCSRYHVKKPIQHLAGVIKGVQRPNLSAPSRPTRVGRCGDILLMALTWHCHVTATGRVQSVVHLRPNWQKEATGFKYNLNLKVKSALKHQIQQTHVIQSSCLQNSFQMQCVFPKNGLLWFTLVWWNSSQDLNKIITVELFGNSRKKIHKDHLCGVYHQW